MTPLATVAPAKTLNTPEAVADHLKGMDVMFSAAIREEMKATQDFLKLLKNR